MRRLRIVTFNVCHDYPRHRHSTRRFELPVDALAAARPDVVCLQEMFVSRRLGHWAERLVGVLRDRDLTYDYFYARANGSIVENGEFEEGSAILSRFRIVDAEARGLATWHEVQRNYSGLVYLERRIAVRTTLEIGDGTRIDAFSAHVTDVAPHGPEPSARALQIADLGKFVADRPCRALPAIVGGDLNATPEAEEILQLEKFGFVDLFRGRSGALTSDSTGRDVESQRDTADRRIDYLFVCDDQSAKFAIHDAGLFLGSAIEIAPGRFVWASDHNGLFADLGFPAN